jgi:hypothetical protein
MPNSARFEPGGYCTLGCGLRDCLGGNEGVSEFEVERVQALLEQVDARVINVL